MKVYLAGPMRGHDDFNFPAFHAAAKKLREEGHDVFNPAEHSPPEAEQGIIRAALALDLDWICKEADAIALLPGWSASAGANAELMTAKALGLEVRFL